MFDNTMAVQVLEAVLYFAACELLTFIIMHM